VVAALSKYISGFPLIVSFNIGKCLRSDSMTVLIFWANISQKYALLLFPTVALAINILGLIAQLASTPNESYINNVAVLQFARYRL
jgi:hypothetical protein